MKHKRRNGERATDTGERGKNATRYTTSGRRTTSAVRREAVVPRRAAHLARREKHSVGPPGREDIHRIRSSIGRTIHLMQAVLSPTHIRHFIAHSYPGWKPWLEASARVATTTAGG